MIMDQQNLNKNRHHEMTSQHLQNDVITGGLREKTSRKKTSKISKIFSEFQPKHSQEKNKYAPNVEMCGQNEKKCGQNGKK